MVEGVMADKPKLTAEEKVASLTAFWRRLYPEGEFGIIEKDGEKRVYFSLPQFNIYVENPMPEDTE